MFYSWKNNYVASLTGGSVAGNTIRLRGYSIRVSNTSNVSPIKSTSACFIDDMSHILPTVIQEDCKKTTRYVWFYQPHVRDAKVPVLEICEVQIFGKMTSCVTLSEQIALIINIACCFVKCIVQSR